MHHVPRPEYRFLPELKHVLACYADLILVLILNTHGTPFP
jgi:hypothetical protein